MLVMHLALRQVGARPETGARQGQEVLGNLVRRTLFPQVALWRHTGFANIVEKTAAPSAYVQAKAVLLTYNGVENVSVWDSFKTVVGARLREWKVRYYGARGPCYGSLEWAQWLAQPARVMQSCCVWLKVLRARSVYPFLRAWLKMFLARDVWNSLPFYLYSSRNATPTNLDFCAHACSKRFCATL